MDELSQMIEAIKKTNVHTNLRLIYEEIPEKTNHIITHEIHKQATNDLKLITDALELIKKYEKYGVSFNFLNYQTKMR